MFRFVIPLALVCSIACSSDATPQLPAAGEACDADGQCAAGLDCVRLVCADDSGPNIFLQFPTHLASAVYGSTSLIVGAIVNEAADGDQVEIIIDPGSDHAHAEVFAIPDLRTPMTMSLPAPLAIGPHHLRARVIDGDGQPYTNPSASTEVVLFTRDPMSQDTPQVALVWPPSGYQHRIGDPLEVAVAVLPGTFVFVMDGGWCQPLADCEPELAPECEDECGPVERSGHAKLYLEPDYPECLLDVPIGCNGEYIMSLRPGSGVEVLDAHQVRAVIPADYLALGSQPGSKSLTVALSYGDHDPYPSQANVIYETITLELVE